MTAKGYEYLPHPADAKFRAWGLTFEEAVRNSASALAGLMWDCREVEAAESIPVEIEGCDREQLLVKFLSEILYLLDVRGFILCSIDKLSIERDRGIAGGGTCPAAGEAPGYRIRTLFRGGNVSSGAEIFGSVKAVTYSELKIERADTGRWTIEVVVDA
jgi:SHS2 domain-containing protein